MTKIYLIHSDENGYYKIGVSRNPARRKNQLQTGSTGQLKLIAIYPSNISFKVEKTLKNNLAYCKVKGEWFDLGIEFESKFIDECRKIEKNINLLIENQMFFD